MVLMWIAADTLAGHKPQRERDRIYYNALQDNPWTPIY